MKVEDEISEEEKKYWYRYEDIKRISFTVALQVLENAISIHRATESDYSLQTLNCSSILMVETLSSVFKDLAINLRKEAGIKDGDVPAFKFIRIEEKNPKMPRNYEG